MQDTTPTRPVPFWRLFMRGWGWITVFVVPFVVVVLAIALHSGYHMALLASEGVETEAVITQKRRIDADGDSRTRGRMIHELEFTFTAAGEEITDRVQVSKAFSNSVKRLETVPLRYAASAPLVNEIEPGANAHEVFKVTVALLIVLGVSGPILWRQRHRARRMIRARDHGKEVKATVTSYDKSRLLINDKSSYRLHWTDENGTSGRSTLVNRHAKRLFPVGSEITLYVDPDDGFAVWQVEVGVPRQSG